MATKHQQFEYVTSKILPQIGSTVLTFVLHASWETIMSDKTFQILFHSPISLLFPHVQIVVLKWFSSERLYTFMDNLNNLSQLIHLDIRGLRGNTPQKLITKMFSLSHGQLKSITIDNDSVDLVLSDDDQLDCYPNIEELKINIKSCHMLEKLLKALPNLRRFHVFIGEFSCDFEPKQLALDSLTFRYLFDFEMRSTGLFWMLDEIVDLLRQMQYLQKLSLDIRTADKRFFRKEHLDTFLPTSVTDFSFFVRYHYFDEDFDADILLHDWPPHIPVSLWNDGYLSCALIHSIPLGFRSLSLSAGLAKQVSSGWKYTNNVEDLYIYDATSIVDILNVLQHFHRLQMLTVDIEHQTDNGKYGCVNHIQVHEAVECLDDP